MNEEMQCILKKYALSKGAENREPLHRKGCISLKDAELWGHFA